MKFQFSRDGLDIRQPSTTRCGGISAAVTLIMTVLIFIWCSSSR